MAEEEIENTPRLITAWPEEVKTQLYWAYEYAYHTGVRPKGEAPFETDVDRADTQSKGDGRSDLNVAGTVDAPRSLGVRQWIVDDPEFHDVYSEPTESEFEAEPYITMGHVNFDETSDKQVDVDDQGRRVGREAVLKVPVWHHQINDLPAPEEGDLVEFWADSWHDLGVFYNVIETYREGFIGNSPYFVEWHIELRRRDEAVPERRLLGAL